MEAESNLDCPLCLKQFHQPRLLDQCMHSFCNVCLCSYIRPLLSADNAIKKISCPVCQTVFQGPNSSTELINWVEKLPSDPLLNNSLERDADEKQNNCEPCSVRGKQTKARKFCKECTEKLCEQCADVHMSFRGTRTHTLAKIDGHDSVELDLEPLPMCEYHGKKEVEYYCKDHDELICSKCAVLKHRDCDLAELDTAAESLTKLFPVEKIQSCFQSLKSDVNDVDITIQKKNEHFQSEVREAVLDVEDKQKNVNAAFDRFKAKIAKDVNQQLHQAKEVKTDTERIAIGIENSLTLLDTAEKKGKYVQVFLRGKAMTRQIEGTRQRIKDCKTKYSSVHFEYDLSPNVTAIISNKSALGKFSVSNANSDNVSGFNTQNLHEANTTPHCTEHTEYIEDVTVVKSAKLKSGEPEKLNVGTLEAYIDTEPRKGQHESMGTGSLNTEGNNKGKQRKKADVRTKRKKSTVRGEQRNRINAHEWGVTVSSIMQTDVRVKTTKTVKVQLPDDTKPYFGGAAYLADDRVVITDVRYFRLLLLDSNLNYVSELKLDRMPRKIAAVGKDEVAVGLNKDRRILIIKVGKGMVIIKSIYTRSFTKCITGSSSGLFLSAYENRLEDEWHLTCLDLESDDEIKLGNIHGLLDGAHMVVFNRNDKNFLLYSCREDDTVKCYTSDGQEVFSCKIQGPVGVDVDQYGNIFVASCVRHKIHHLSPTGSLVKTLEAGYMSKPYEVRMNTTQDKVLVTQYESSEIHILGLCYELQQ